MAPNQDHMYVHVVIHICNALNINSLCDKLTILDDIPLKTKPSLISK